MLVTMDDPKPKQRRVGRPPKNPATPLGERSNVGFNARVDPEVSARFFAFHKRYDRKHQLKTERSAHIEKAIVQYLDREEQLLDDQETA